MITLASNVNDGVLSFVSDERLYLIKTFFIFLCYRNNCKMVNPFVPFPMPLRITICGEAPLKTPAVNQSWLTVSSCLFLNSHKTVCITKLFLQQTKKHHIHKIIQRIKCDLDRRTRTWS